MQNGGGAVIRGLLLGRMTEPGPGRGMCPCLRPGSALAKWFWQSSSTDISQPSTPARRENDAHSRRRTTQDHPVGGATSSGRSRVAWVHDRPAAAACSLPCQVYTTYHRTKAVGRNALRRAVGRASLSDLQSPIVSLELLLWACRVSMPPYSGCGNCCDSGGQRCFLSCARDPIRSGAEPEPSLVKLRPCWFRLIPSRHIFTLAGRNR